MEKQRAKRQKQTNKQKPGTGYLSAYSNNE